MSFDKIYEEIFGKDIQVPEIEEYITKNKLNVITWFYLSGNSFTHLKTKCKKKEDKCVGIFGSVICDVHYKRIDYEEEINKCMSAFIYIVDDKLYIHILFVWYFRELYDEKYLRNVLVDYNYEKISENYFGCIHLGIHNAMSNMPIPEYSIEKLCIPVTSKLDCYITEYSYNIGRLPKQFDIGIDLRNEDLNDKDSTDNLKHILLKAIPSKYYAKTLLLPMTIKRISDKSHIKPMSNSLLEPRLIRLILDLAGKPSKPL